MQEFVRGIHLVTNEGHFFVQRLTDMVVTDDYATILGGATLVSDDDLFDAAVVSFGNLGLVHGILIEAEPLYLLRYVSVVVVVVSFLKTCISRKRPSKHFYEC